VYLFFTYRPRPERAVCNATLGIATDSYLIHPSRAHLAFKCINTIHHCSAARVETYHRLTRSVATPRGQKSYAAFLLVFRGAELATARLHVVKDLFRFASVLKAPVAPSPPQCPRFPPSDGRPPDGAGIGVTFSLPSIDAPTRATFCSLAHPPLGPRSGRRS
jgi:hypothetical protein